MISQQVRGLVLSHGHQHPAPGTLGTPPAVGCSPELREPRVMTVGRLLGTLGRGLGSSRALPSGRGAR